MSVTERLREHAERVRASEFYRVVAVDVDEAEALCDIAEHAAALIESGVSDDDGDAIAIRDALARLDRGASA